MIPMPTRIFGYAAAALGLALAVNAIIVAYVGVYDIAYTRALIVYASVASVLLGCPLAAAVPKERTLLLVFAWLADIVAVAAFTVAIWYFVSAADELSTMLVSYDNTDI